MYPFKDPSRRDTLKRSRLWLPNLVFQFERSLVMNATHRRAPVAQARIHGVQHQGGNSNPSVVGRALAGYFTEQFPL